MEQTEAMCKYNIVISLACCHKGVQSGPCNLRFQSPETGNSVSEVIMKALYSSDSSVGAVAFADLFNNDSNNNIWNRVLME
jgi:hypothetical protein